MKLVHYDAGIVYQTETLDFVNSPHRGSLVIAITSDAVRRRMGRGLRWQLGQLYGIVCTGAIHVEYVFKGLRRRMFVADDPNADEEKLALVWRPESDFYLEGDPFNCSLRPFPVLERKVFVTYLSPNRMTTAFADVFAWIEHWTWVDADPTDPGRPVEWTERYDACIWPAQ